MSWLIAICFCSPCFSRRIGWWTWDLRHKWNQCKFVTGEQFPYLTYDLCSLDAMGGSLKSEIESEAYQQEARDLQEAGVARHRLTAMFSATMPAEVESIAKRYLRHPSIVSIGDRDSSKNARIEQRLVWLPTPARKEDALKKLLREPRFLREKIIVFVNERKYADNVGKMVERSGRRCVVLHGGKSQDQREENLELFRQGGIVMVATDVAGRYVHVFWHRIQLTRALMHRS